MDSPSIDSPAHARRREVILALVVCAVALLVGFFPVLWGDVLFYRDIAHWVFPARAFFRSTVVEGTWPAWRPLEGLGFSLHGDPLHGLFYPPNWLFLLAGDNGVARMATLQAMAHMAFGGYGAYRLAKRLGCEGVVATVAAVAWLLSGIVAAFVSTGVLALAAAWIPWQALGQLALLDAAWVGGRRIFAGVGKAALPLAFAILLGEVFFACAGVIAGALALLVVVFSEYRRRGAPPRILWVGWGLAIVLGGMVGMAGAGPAFIGRTGTERAAPLPRDVAESWSFHPMRALELALPRAVGVNEDQHPALSLVGDAKVDGGPMTYNAYAGISVLVLALLAVSRRNRLTVGLLGGALFFLILALGKHLPVHGVWRVVIPPLSYMRYPEKYLLFVPVFLAPLAAMGARRLLDGEGRGRLLISFVVVAGVAVYAYVGSRGSFQPFLRGGAVHAAGVLAALGAVAWLSRRWARQAPVWLLAVVVVDLWVGRIGSDVWLPGGWAGRASVAAQVIRRDFDGTGNAVHPRLFRAAGVYPATLRAAPPSTPAEKELLALRTLVPNHPTTHGIAMVPGYDVAVDPGFLNFWGRALSHGQAVLRLLSVNYALLPAPTAGKPERTGLVPLGDPAPGARLYRVPDPLPRVYVPAEVLPVPESEMPDGLLAPEVFSGFRALVAVGTAEVERRPSSPGRCEAIPSSPNRFEARCRMEGEGLAVFVEQFAPGWSATVDGTAAPILRTNLFMRGVRIPAGEHMVSMTFTPPGRAGSVAVSLAGLAALALCLFIGRRGRVGVTTAT